MKSGCDLALSHCAAIEYFLPSSLIVLASSTWHSESFHPLCLSQSNSHTDYAAEHCVWSFDVRTKAQQCLMLSNVRENTIWAFTVYARNGKRNLVKLCHNDTLVQTVSHSTSKTWALSNRVVV